jgi:hypothetical protein
MQHSFSVTPATMNSIQSSVSKDRLGRYMPAAGNDPQLALRLYVWNARLCEAFYLPCQIAEVTVRNSIHRALKAHFGVDDWFFDPSFRNQLTPAAEAELNKAINTKQKDHGVTFTFNHVIAGLSFGFWTHMLTHNFEKCGVWPSQIATAFPNAGPTTSRKQIYRKIDQIRAFRNRIAHQGAVFDRAPQQAHHCILDVIGWTCQDTRWLAETLSRLNQAINARPRA